MTTALGAQEVLRKVVATYSSMTSYSDTGQVLTRFNSTGKTYQITFSTLYQKPSLFRFTSSRPHPYPPLSHVVTHHEAGHDGTAGYTVTRRPDGEIVRRSPIGLEEAVARATGISRGAAHTIGRLLLAEVSGRSLLDSTDARREEDVAIGETLCYLIVSRGAKHVIDERLWIEKDSFVLRKVICRWEDHESEETRENIAIDVPLDRSLFGT